MNRSVLTNIGVGVIFILMYLLLIDNLNQNYKDQHSRLIIKQKDYQHMQNLAKNIAVNTNRPSSGSLLGDISRLRDKNRLNQGFNKISIDKNTASVALKSADYRRLITFLIEAKSFSINVLELNLTRVGDGLVNGKVKLER